MLDKEKNFFGIACGVAIGDNYWCLSYYHNNLYKMDLGTGEIEKFMDLPYRNVMYKRSYADIINWNSVLCLIPQYAENLILVDIYEKKLKIIELNSDVHKDDELWTYGGAFLHNDFLYIYTGKIRALYKINLNNYHIEKKVFSNDTSFIIPPNSHFIYDDYAYIPSGIPNEIIKLNLNKYDFEYIEIKCNHTKDMNICNCAVIKDEIMMASDRNGLFKKYREKDNSITEVKVDSKYKEYSYRFVQQIITYDREFHVFLSYGDEILSCEYRGDKLKQSKINIALREIKNVGCNIVTIDPYLVFNVKKETDKLYIILGKFDCLLIYNFKDDSYKYYFTQYNETENLDYFCKDNNIVAENCLFSAIEYFLNISPKGNK